MKKTWLLTLVLAITMPVLLTGCLIARDIKTGNMDPKEREKLADCVADKVVAKLKAGHCPQNAAQHAEPNNPVK